jgi:hypothetical protein
MGIETLNSAARAAGFAMATTDEPDGKPVEKQESAAWRSEPVLLSAPAPHVQAKSDPSLSDWVKGMFSFRRGAPA